MKQSDHLKFTTEHLWVRPSEEGNLEAGITDYAQDLLGDIVFVQAPEVGVRLIAGAPCGLVESVKTGSDLHAPLNGVVSAVNESLDNTPELINDKPYQAWIFKFKPDNPDDITQLLSKAAYQQLLGMS